MPSTPDSPFNEIVDDYAPRRDAVEWAILQLESGRDFEPVKAELLEQGWDAEQTQLIVEEARQETRRARGVVTRDDVVRDSTRRYRQGMRMGWFTGFPVLSSLWRLIHSLANLISLGAIKGRSRKG